MTSQERTTALKRYRPEPGRWWTAQTPVSWPGAGGFWTHLAERALGNPGGGAVPAIHRDAVQEVIYLPPVEPAQAAARGALVAELKTAGRPVLVQCQPQEPGHQDAVLDLLSTLLNRDFALLDGLATAATRAVWPLIPGLTDDPRDWDRGLARLAAVGFETVVPMTVTLSPSQRRELAELTDDAGYQALFHGAAPDERAFAQVATAHGLGITPPRLPLASTPRREFCRQAATELAVVAELWLRLGRGEVAGQNLLRAARWMEDSDRDLRALAREGNLGILPWLDGDALHVVEDLIAAGSSSLRRALEEEYAGATP